MDASLIKDDIVTSVIDLNSSLTSQDSGKEEVRVKSSKERIKVLHLNNIFVRFRSSNADNIITQSTLIEPRK